MVSWEHVAGGGFFLQFSMCALAYLRGEGAFPKREDFSRLVYLPNILH